MLIWFSETPKKYTPESDNECHARFSPIRSIICRKTPNRISSPTMVDMIQNMVGCHIRRPKDPFAKPFAVYDLTLTEHNKLKDMNVGNKHIQRVILCKSYVYGNLSYEITYRKSNGLMVFSIHRSKDRMEAENVYSRICVATESLMKRFHGKSKGSTAQLLSHIVPCCNLKTNWSSAHIAAHLSLYQVFKDVVAEVVERINVQSADRLKTPLHIAIHSGHVPTIKAILNLNPNLLIVDDFENTVLHYAAMSTEEIFFILWSVDGVKQLIDWRNWENCTPLHLACYKSRTGIIKQLLKEGLTTRQMSIRPPEKDPKEVYETYDNDKKHPFTKEMLADLNEHEISLGGCPLHWVTTRKTLDHLLCLGLDTDIPNLYLERPAHVLTRNRHFKCLVGMLSNDYSQSQKVNWKKETPLHYAVAVSEVPSVQSLVVFDSDVDSLNDQNESARHLASITKSKPNELIIWILHSVGAKRCSPQMIGCGDGCSAHGSHKGLRYSKWLTYEDETLYKKMLLEQVIQEARRRKRKRMEMKDQIPGADQSSVKSADSYREYSNSGKKRAVMFTLDGGGVRGLITAQILCELDSLLDYPLSNYFEWAVGTSTGGMIASLLCLRYSPQEIRRVYFIFKDKLLSGRKPYHAEVFDAILKEFVGENTIMGSIGNHKLIVTGVLADRIPPQLHLFRSYQSPAEIIGYKPNSRIFKPLPSCNEQYLWSACRASGSAPYYFPSHNGFIDGGVIANNPTLDALTEFILYNEALKTRNRKDEMEDLDLVVSIGTGKVPVKPRKNSLDFVPPFPSLIHPIRTYRNIIKGKEILFMLMDEATCSDNHVVDRSMAWCRGMNVPQFRLSPPLSNDIPLDQIDDIKVINSLYETKAYMYAMRNQIRALIELLQLETEVPNDPLRREYRPLNNSVYNISLRAEEESSHGKQGKIKKSLLKTKERVQNLWGKNSSSAENQAEPTDGGLDYSTKSPHAGRHPNLSPNSDSGPPGPPKSASVDVTTMSEDDVRRDLENDFKVRDAVLLPPPVRK